MCVGGWSTHARFMQIFHVSFAGVRKAHGTEAEVRYTYMYVHTLALCDLLYLYVLTTHLYSRCIVPV